MMEAIIETLCESVFSVSDEWYLIEATMELNYKPGFSRLSCIDCVLWRSP